MFRISPELSQSARLRWCARYHRAWGVDAAQAEPFVSKFGLDKSKLEGRVYQAVVESIDGLLTEVNKSVKFFQGRYPAARIEKIIVAGGAATIPELPVYMANQVGIVVEIGNAWRNVNLPKERVDELSAVANHFSVAVGLAERDE